MHGKRCGMGISLMTCTACLVSTVTTVAATPATDEARGDDARADSQCRYYDYHHTAADTLDKVEAQRLQSQVATLAVLAYFLAELPEPLPRFKISR
jgi:hypothetical protein